MLALTSSVLLATAAPTLNAATGPLRWRDAASAERVAALRALPTPPLSARGLAGAKALHADAKRRARQIAREAGHAAPIDPPPRPARAAAALGRCDRPGEPSQPQGWSPSAWGADPSGRVDSSPAFGRMLSALFNASAHHKRMAANIVDLGGATVDLGGGDYLLSQPLLVPPFFGNVHFVDGTLRAAPSFPPSSWLVQVGNLSCQPLLPNGKPDGQGSCVEFVTFSNMLFDAAHVAAGGVNIANAMGATVGPSAFFIGFKQAGVRIDGGHEVMIIEAWLAECYWSNFEALGGPCAGESPGSSSPEWKSESIGILINGPDNYLENVRSNTAVARSCCRLSSRAAR